MKSLTVRERSLNFGYKTLTLEGDPPAQRNIAILRHQLAVQKALQMIKERLQDPPTLAELAALSRLSRTYFSHVFKEITGTKLQEYILQTRLEKAQNLLSCIDLKVKEVSYEIGFKDPNYFCRAFKKWTGSNPTNWRIGKFFSHKTNLMKVKAGKPL